MKIWFTSDFHFGHSNMLTWGGRPFKTVKEMDEYLLDLWNSTIKPQDKVYFLGDLALRDPHPYLPHLKGRIHFIKGNHDQQSDNWYRQQSNIDWVGDLYKFKQGELYIVLMHYSMRVWPRSHYNSWHLFGHSHGGINDKNTGKSFDVGIDVWK